MYAENNTPTVHCWRCGAVADVEWFDVCTFSDPGPVLIQGNTRCMTPGCVDWNGSNETSDVPPSPWELAAAAARLAATFWKRQSEVFG